MEVCIVVGWLIEGLDEEVGVVVFLGGEVSLNVLVGFCFWCFSCCVFELEVGSVGMVDELSLSFEVLMCFWRSDFFFCDWFFRVFLKVYDVEFCLVCVCWSGFFLWVVFCEG